MGWFLGPKPEMGSKAWWIRDFGIFSVSFGLLLPWFFYFDFVRFQWKDKDGALKPRLYLTTYSKTGLEEEMQDLHAQMLEKRKEVLCKKIFDLGLEPKKD